MSIEIRNLRTLKDRSLWKQEPFDMRVDRQSPVGNPEPMKCQTDIERLRVCTIYEKDFERQMENPYFRAYIESLIKIYKRHGRLRLWCWCAPHRCHAETIKAYINQV